MLTDSGRSLLNRIRTGSFAVDVFGATLDLARELERNGYVREMADWKCWPSIYFVATDKGKAALK